MNKLIFIMVSYCCAQSLSEITYSMMNSISCNLVALKTCALKLYQNEADQEIMYLLAQSHLFGFPINKGDKHLQYCLNYGDYIVDGTYVERNITLAYSYFNLIPSYNDSSIYMVFIQKLQVKEGNQNIQIDYQDIYMGYTTTSDQVTFNAQYNCYKYNKPYNCTLCKDINKYDIIEQLFQGDNYLQMIKQVNTNCQACEYIFQYGYRVALEAIQDYIAEGPTTDFNIDEYLISEQMAQNEDEAALLQYAYYHYVGNQELGINRNQQLAQQLFQNMQNNGLALYNLGIFEVQNGDYASAFKYFNQSAQQHIPQAFEGLGYLYLNGFHVEMDLVMAEYYYRIAVELGSEYAKITLAVLFVNRGDINGGIELLRPLEYLEAKFQLVDIYSKFKPNQITCEESLQLIYQVISKVYYSDYKDNNDIIVQEWAAFLGLREPVNVFEQFMYGIQGAASKIADQLIDNVELQQKLYRIDADQIPSSLYQLSYLSEQAGDYENATHYIDSLIRRSQQGQFDSVNLFPAYVWKCILTIKFIISLL